MTDLGWLLVILAVLAFVTLCIVVLIAIGSAAHHDKWD